MSDYTTGQAAGFTRLNVKTIQRYIRNHADYFSPKAKQPQKGRRYTAQDIKNLLLINQLSKLRTPKERINEALAGRWIPESMPMIEIENALQIAQVTQTAMAQSKGHADKAQNERLILEGNLTWIKKTLREMRETIEAHESELYRLRQLIGVMTGAGKPQEKKHTW
jgi:DNA-binding transcriptional MerR regulator